MTNDRPAPLIAADVDLRGLEYMPLLGARLFSSDFNAHADDTEWRAALTLWWAAWQQVPAGSLPDDDVVLCRLAEFGRDMKTWRRVRDRALHGFVACSDGRLYHAVLCEQALIAWEKRSESLDRRSGEVERKRREREERSRMFDTLRKQGVTPPWNTSTADLRRLVTQPVTPTVTRTGEDKSPPVTDQSPPVTPPVTRTVTAKTVRYGTVIDETGEIYPPYPLSDDDPDSLTEPIAVPLNPAVQVCVALKAAGVSSVNAGHPKLKALVDAGADASEFLAFTEKAREAAPGKEFPYLLACVENARKSVADAALRPGPAPASTVQRQTAVDRQIATMNALTGRDRRHANPDAPIASVIDVPARLVR